MIQHSLLLSVRQRKSRTVFHCLVFSPHKFFLVSALPRPGRILYRSPREVAAVPEWSAPTLFTIPTQHYGIVLISLVPGKTRTCLWEWRYLLAEADFQTISQMISLIDGGSYLFWRVPRSTFIPNANFPVRYWPRSTGLVLDGWTWDMPIAGLETRRNET